MSGVAHNQNTDAAGKRFNPSAYRLKGIQMINHRGEDKFIENIVVKFSISESLYSPTCILDLSIQDSVNFFESFPILGQETIRILLEYRDHNTGTEKTLDLKFFVAEYPTYGRSKQNNHVQVYRIRGISEQAYISGHKKISRSYNQSKTVDIIQNILERDCNLTSDAYTVSGDSVSKIKWNCPYMTPFNAIEHLRARTYDQSGAPFYLFATIDGKMNMISHSACVNATYGQSDVYQTYFDARQFSSDPNTAKDYVERATRILECNSNLKLSKLDQSRQGAFTSETYNLDYTTKSYTQNIFQRDDYENTLEKQKIYSEQFKISDGLNQPTKSVDEFSSAHIEYIPTTSGAFIDDLDLEDADTGSLYNDLTIQSIAAMNSYRASANNTTHDILLHGDFQLNPGKKVQLLFPKALDPEQLKEYLDVDDSDVYDKSLSGKYLIAAVEHTFEGGKYYSNCRVKRDSMSLNI